MNIIKKMLSGRFTLKELGLTLRDIRKLKDAGYTVQSQKVRGETYYYITLGNEMSSLYISGASKKPVEVKFVELSDTHFGSHHCDVAGIKEVLKRAVDEGYKDVHFSGDLCDGSGSVYPLQRNDLRYWKSEDQAALAVETLSQFPLKYIAITGN